MASGKSISQSSTEPAGGVARVRSIAGRSHGAKPSADAALSKSPKKWYPQLEGIVHPDVVSAMRVVFDNLYQLRDEHHAAIKTAATSAQGSASGGGSSSGGSAGSASSKSSLPDSTMATGIHGIRIQAATDPTTLKTGDTIRYNEATSQFEFGS